MEVSSRWNRIALSLGACIAVPVAILLVLSPRYSGDAVLTSEATRTTVVDLVGSLRSAIHPRRMEMHPQFSGDPTVLAALDRLVALGPDAVPPLREMIAENRAFRDLCYRPVLPFCGNMACVEMLNFSGRLEEDAWVNAHLEEAIFRIHNPGQRRPVEYPTEYTGCWCNQASGAVDTLTGAGRAAQPGPHPTFVSPGAK